MSHDWVAAIPQDSNTRIITFLTEYLDAPEDGKMALRVGQAGTSRTNEDQQVPAVMIELSFTDTKHVFTAKECRFMADNLEDQMHRFSDNPLTKSYPNLIIGLRTAADRAEKSCAPKPS